jgi:AcrR family transcriptional regulator
MRTNKEKILDAASMLFLRGGSAALSVRAIAKAAGVSTIGIYSHFEGKQGILDALYIEGFEAVDRAMSVLEPGLSPVDAVLRAASNYLDLAESRPAHYNLIFGESDSSYVPGSDARLAGAAAFNKNVALAANLLPDSVSRHDQEFAAMKVWSVLHGAVALAHHAVVEIVDMADWREQVLDTVLLVAEGIADERTVAKSSRRVK